MKICQINNISNRSHFKSTTPPEKQNKLKIEPRTAKAISLAALATIGIATVAIYSTKTKSPTKTSKVIKNIKRTKKQPISNPSKQLGTKKRGESALRLYNYQRNQQKMNSLHQRLFNGEFDGKSPRAMEKIRRNEIRLAHNLGCLKKA